jgi:hypothetical protein
MYSTFYTTGYLRAAVKEIFYRFQETSVPDPDHMFLDLLGPDPLVRGMDPDPAQDPDPSIIKQKKVRKTLIPTVL